MKAQLPNKPLQRSDTAKHRVAGELAPRTNKSGTRALHGSEDELAIQYGLIK
jgi:hypothetical protein